MATAYTSLLGFALPVTGELDGTWGTTVNNSITELVEDSIAATATASVASGDWTLSTTGSGAANEARCAILIPTGSPGVSRNIIAPAQSKAYVVINQSNAAVVVKGSATTGTTIAAGDRAVVAWNGSDFVTIASTETDGVSTISFGTTGLTPSTATSGAVTVAGTLAVGNGGTGATTLTANNVILGNGTSAVQFVAPGANGNVLTSNGTTWTSAASASDVTKAGNNAFTGANTFYNSTGQTFGTGTSTQDGIVLAGRAGGSSSYRVTLTPGTLSASRTATLPDGGGNYTLGYLNIPAIADKTTSYSLTTADVGKVVGVGSGGSITIPNSTFAAGDAVLIFNNTSGDVTITCTITTAYIAGTDADKATVTLATRGVANILFLSATACVITGNVT